jgi:hypothetical protein
MVEGKSIVAPQEYMGMLPSIKFHFLHIALSTNSISLGHWPSENGIELVFMTLYCTAYLLPSVLTGKSYLFILTNLNCKLGLLAFCYHFSRHS